MGAFGSIKGFYEFVSRPGMNSHRESSPHVARQSVAIGKADG